MTLQTVHFTDLKDHATRGQLERGVRYLKCHDLRERDNFNPFYDESPLPNGAFCYEELVLKPVRMLPRNIDMPTLPPGRKYSDSYDPSAPKPMYGIQSRWRKVSHNFASDSGLWDIEGISYKNEHNYMLNINELLRQGITIDRTTIPSTNRQNGSKSLQL